MSLRAHDAAIIVMVCPIVAGVFDVGVLPALAAVERADANELAHAHGVGEKTAAAIRERFE